MKRRIELELKNREERGRIRMSMTKYTVILTESRNSEQTAIIQLLCSFLNISKDEANRLVEETPSIIAKDISENIACDLKQAIEDCGGKITLLENTRNNADTASKKQQKSAPVFMTPKGNEKASKEKKERSDHAPTFHAPHEEQAPTFRAPHGNEGSAPHFTSPNEENYNYSQNMGSAQRFFQNNCCAYHPRNKAVIQCANCGRPICEECKESGELTDGSYVCYDCAKAIEENDIELAEEKRKKIIQKIMFGIIGAIAFLAISMIPAMGGAFAESGVSLGTWRILLTLFGASLSIYFPILKKIVIWIWKCIRWKPDIAYSNVVFEYVFAIFKGIVIVFAIVGLVTVFSTFLTFSPLVATALGITDFVRYKKADNLVKRNQEILKHLVDRMEYIRVMSEENADNDALANDERMLNNHFAQTVRREGYAEASKKISNEAKEMADNDRKIKKYITNEFGEIVRVA